MIMKIFFVTFGCFLLVSIHFLLIVTYLFDIYFHLNTHL